MDKITSSAAADLDAFKRGKYIGNRTQWEKDPDTGRRIARERPESEWVRHEMPELRIIDEDLWRSVQQRFVAQRADTAPWKTDSTRRGGRRGTKYPLSGLLICAECGSRYVIADAKNYACASHTNGGEHACANRIRVPRTVVEERVIGLLSRDLVTPERVQEVVTLARQKVAAKRRTRNSDTRAREKRLAELEAQIANLTDAVASGALRSSPALAERLRKAEVEHAWVSAENLPKAPVLDLLPRAAERYREMVADLRRTLACDPERARVVLKRMLREVRLVRTADGLVAEVRVPIQRLVALTGSTSLQNSSGSGGLL